MHSIKLIELDIDKYKGKKIVFNYQTDKYYDVIYEDNSEGWSNRLRVWDILLEKEYRRFGYGKLLMDKAKEIAKNKELRLVILETQTCNYKAIEFYKAQGFKFVGTDLTCYSNNDVENKDVRIELGFFLK